MRKISVLHATRRPIQSCATCVSWLKKAYDFNNIEYIASVDTTDTRNYLFPSNVKFIKNDNRSAIDAFNRAAEVATGDLFVCISDDMECFIEWDLALLKEVKGKEDFYLKVQDGLQPTLITMPIFDRTYYNRLGYVWHPDYTHMFCDQEATAVAIMLGRYFKSDLLFKHAHYTTDRSKYDEINRKNDGTWAQGETLFNERLKTNFGITSPVIRYDQIKWR